MDRNRDNRQTGPGDTRAAIVAFAILVVAVVVLALVTTLNGVDTKTTRVDQPPGTIGLAHPHPPLQRAPGEPAQ